MTTAAGELAAIGVRVEWTDAGAAAQARASVAASVRRTPGASFGQLVELTEWLAATEGRCPPQPPKQPRCVVVGSTPTPAVVELADALEARVEALVPEPGAGTDAGFRAGVATADRLVDTGADLLVVAYPQPSVAAALVVGLLADVEPVALLPRGAAAVDTLAWVEQAAALRDGRRAVAELRSQPEELLDTLADPAFAATVSLVMRAVARRTAVVLDGPAAAAAALLCHDVEARCTRWWQLADRSPDPVHTRAATQLGRRPVLDLGTTTGDGTAGLLALPVIRAAAGLARADSAPRPRPRPGAGVPPQ